MPDRSTWMYGGIAGVAGCACYLLAIVVPWPESRLGTSASLIVVSGFPVLSIIFSYALCTFVAAERDSTANRLAFVFAALAFTTVLAMLLVQLAIGAAIGEITKGLEAGAARSLRRGLRMVDLGLDVAWDMLIGTSLIFLGAALRRRSGFGPGWGVPLVFLGAALIVLNAATFPWPPGDHGLFDVGPLVGGFVMALAVRLVVLARRAPAA